MHVNIGGGPTFNAGDLGDHFGNGWGPAIGVTFDMSRFAAFQFEYAYRWFDIKDDAPFFGATRFSANHTTHQLDFNFIGSFAPTGATIRPYVLAGPGIYYRSVEITDTSATVSSATPTGTSAAPTRSRASSARAVAGTLGSTSAAASGLASARRRSSSSSRGSTTCGDRSSTATTLPAGAEERSGSANGTYYPLTFGFRF